MMGMDRYWNDAEYHARVYAGAVQLRRDMALFRSPNVVGGGTELVEGEYLDIAMLVIDAADFTVVEGVMSDLPEQEIVERLKGAAAYRREFGPYEAASIYDRAVEEIESARAALRVVEAERDSARALLTRCATMLGSDEVEDAFIGTDSEEFYLSLQEDVTVELACPNHTAEPGPHHSIVCCYYDEAAGELAQ